MPELYVDGSVTPGRLTKDHSWLGARGLRDGSLVAASWADALAQEGRVFTANMGTVTTPITFLVTAANRPDAWVRVPANTAILPLKISIAIEAMTGTATEIDVRMASNDIGNGTSSAAAVGPLSVRSDNPIVSACVARQLATADTTAETTPISLFRKTYILANDAGSDGSKGAEITREMMGYPVLVGAASWEVFVAATTNQATGFVVMTYAEVPSSMFV